MDVVDSVHDYMTGPTKADTKSPQGMDGSSSEGKGLGRGRLPCQSGRGRLEEFTGTRLVPRLMRQRWRVKTEFASPKEATGSVDSGRPIFWVARGWADREA